MLLRFEATNGGAKFSEIADEVILLDIIEQPAEVDIQKSRLAGGAGMRVSSVTRTSLTVNLVYVIRTQDPVRRAFLRDKVAQWALQASHLEVSTRPGKYLSAVPYIAPAQDSSLKWTQELTLAMTAYDVPYWRDSDVTSASYTTNDFVFIGGHAITPTGADTAIPISCIITTLDEQTLTDVEVGVGNTKIVLSGLDVKTGFVDGWYSEGNVAILCDDGHNMRIGSLSGVSYLKHRTPESDDVLLAQQNIRNVIYCKANVPCSITFSWNGWWV